jgi:mannosyltransferase
MAWNIHRELRTLCSAILFNPRGLFPQKNYLLLYVWTLAFGTCAAVAEAPESVNMHVSTAQARVANRFNQLLDRFRGLKQDNALPGKTGERWLFVAICGIAIATQLFVAQRSGLYVDEVFSLGIATGHSLDHPAAKADPAFGDFAEADHPRPVQDFQRYLKHDRPPASLPRLIRAVFLADTHPPLYYVLLYIWTLTFGTSDFALRSFSITCSWACLPFLIAIARRIGGAKAVIPSCVLFLFSPLGVYYSTEGRMYSLLWVGVLATIWASLLLHDCGPSRGRCAFWIAASAAGLFTQYFFVFPWIATLVYLFVSPGKLSRRTLLVCLVGTGLIVLPWYIVVPETIRSWGVTKDWIKRRPVGFNLASLLTERVLQPFAGTGDLSRHGAVVAVMVFGCAASAMMWRLRLRIFGEQRSLVWLGFATASAGPFVFDIVWHTYTAAFPRYAIAALPLAYLGFSVGLAQLSRGVRIATLSLILLAWGPDLVKICWTPWRSLPPLRELSHAATEKATGSDLIIAHGTPSGVLGIARYATGPAPLASWVPQLGNRHLPQSILTLAAGRRHIIFVKVYSPMPGFEERWLRSHATLLSERTISIGRVSEFAPVNSQTF